MFTAQELATLSEDFESRTPQEIIQWAAGTVAVSVNDDERAGRWAGR